MRLTLRSQPPDQCPVLQGDHSPIVVECSLFTVETVQFSTVADTIDYGLSAELTAILRGGYELWESNFSPESGWVTPAAKARWVAASEQGLAVLRREVDGFAEVVDERNL